ncbi:hypothetical protein R70006_06327 [Paraburkholderia domus]|uniref:hypothetical protein n=1 Tax=Paraburkholderia domus TaxID=2793075 RepID=UPI0019137F9B|nr:hypothetical protein [Paraburkholderia domus]MBK5052952.1 hypothetical protein [Burkholderia sp. R-70006]CAE6823626.1 hypothetical protein R70006_06327 [Paraburkholderia domus]
MGARVPPEFKSQTPDRLRHLAQRYGVKLPCEVQQALLDAANEIEGSEEAFGTVVDDKRELKKELDRTGALLRSAYDMFASAKKQSE